jgi:hypothetical protein
MADDALTPSAPAVPTPPEEQRRSISQLGYGDRVLAVSGYLLVGVSVLSFSVIVIAKLLEATFPERYGRYLERYDSWLAIVQAEASTITLILIGALAATLGRRLLVHVRLADTRTIPYDDLPLVRQAVIDGKPEPIDQYVRLRSLSGMSGNFTKLGITGLPLTTVLLTLIFSFIALMPVPQGKDFLDLAKLTLGAFIGSFVQRQVEQRRQERGEPANGSGRRGDLVA